MTHIISGDDALNLMSGSNDGGESSKEFSKFNVGTTYKVKVLGMKDFFAFYNYGIYGQINSFVAEKPSKKTDKGFPIEDLTPWDKAFLYHRDKSERFGDEQSEEAYKYKPELRYAMGFFDLEKGERIVIDVSRKQAQTLQEIIVKYGKRLDKAAFEVSKSGGGAVSLMPVFDMEEDLSEKERENFEKAPDEFKIEDFHGILFKATEDEQIENLIAAGFDISLIGLEAPAKGDAPAEEQGEESEYDF